MAKRSADTADGSIGERAGSALDAVVQPVQSVVNSVREAVSSAVSGAAGFMKEPRAAVKTTARKAAKVAKPAPRKTTSRKPAAARSLARGQH